MVCEGYGEVFDEAASAARHQERVGSAVPVPLHGQQRLPRRPVRLHQRRCPRHLRPTPARGARPRLRRLDGGLRRVHADRRARATAPPGRRCTTSTRGSTTARPTAPFAPGGCPLRFIRSGWTGVAPCAQIVWNGDPTTDWGFDGLQSALRNGLTMGLSGISRWGSDIGGFFALGSRRLTPELLIRWIELGAVSGVMRSQANGFALPSKPRPQLSDPDGAPLATLGPPAHSPLPLCRRGGRPLPARRHAGDAPPGARPGDARASRRDEEFLFGPDILAAPVMEPGKRTRALPARRPLGRPLARGALCEASRPASGGRPHRGGRSRGDRRRAATPASPRRLGAAVPAAGGRHAVAVRRRPPPAQAGRPLRRLDLVAFPRGRRRGWIGRALPVERATRPLDAHAEVKRRRYRLYASLGTLRRPFIYARGKRVRRRAWSYSPPADAAGQLPDALGPLGGAAAGASGRPCGRRPPRRSWAPAAPATSRRPPPASLPARRRTRSCRTRCRGGGPSARRHSCRPSRR